MLIKGEWLPCDDGVLRPVVKGLVLDVRNRPIPEHFLVDPGADNTILGASLLDTLSLPTLAPLPGLAVRGIGGDSEYVVVEAVIRFAREQGDPIRIDGRFAAFASPASSDISILGRDVLNSFDVIISRRSDQVWLIGGNHGFQLVQA
jgi:hypothetical protein